MMRSIERTLGGRVVAIECAPEQAAPADDLMSTLQRLTAAQPPWAGMTVRVGWSLLQLGEAADGRLILCEPDYLGNPFAELRPRVDITLRVLAAQSALAHAVGVVPVDVGFEQFIVVGRGALAASAVQLVRAESLDADDSGWSLDRLAGGAAPGDYEALRAYTLLSERPAVLSALILPVGFAAVIRGPAIAEVRDPEGNRRLFAPLFTGRERRS
jgi:hypothetical protein